MMETILLSKEIMVKGEAVKEVTLDFDALTGNDLAKAEREVRAMGDQTPSVFLSMQYQAAVAAKLIGVPVDDVFAMTAGDFKKVVIPVANFLLTAHSKMSAK